MANIFRGAKVEMTLTFVVNEEEARALSALACYGTDAFVKAFYENLGKTYMQPHEAGLRSFLNSIGDGINGHLACADAARKAFHSTPQ